MDYLRQNMVSNVITLRAQDHKREEAHALLRSLFDLQQGEDSDTEASASGLVLWGMRMKLLAVREAEFISGWLVNHPNSTVRYEVCVVNALGVYWEPGPIFN